MESAREIVQSETDDVQDARNVYTGQQRYDDKTEEDEEPGGLEVTGEFQEQLEKEKDMCPAEVEGVEDEPVFFCSPAESDEESEGEEDPAAGDAGGAAVAVEQKAHEREGKDDEPDEIELLHGGEHPGNVGGWFCAGESGAGGWREKDVVDEGCVLLDASAERNGFAGKFIERFDLVDEGCKNIVATENEKQRDEA